MSYPLQFRPNVVPGVLASMPMIPWTMAWYLQTARQLLIGWSGVLGSLRREA